MRHRKSRHGNKRSPVISFEDVSRQRRKAQRPKGRLYLATVTGTLAVALLGAGALFATGSIPQLAAAVGLARGGDCTLVSVHDGDTIRCDGEKIRLANIDAPELEGSPRCDQLSFGKNPSWCDYQLAMKSRDALDDFLDAGPMKIKRLGTDRYGRTLARINVDGNDAGAHLISLGLARTWVQ